MNSQIHQLLGSELEFPFMDSFDDIGKNEAFLRKKNPNNIMIEMIRWGVYPIHPEINYIPRKPDMHARPPNGTFIELRLYDPQKLDAKMRERFRKDPSGYAEFSRKLAMYFMYKRLDDVFNRLVLRSNYGSAEMFKLDQVVLTAIHGVLEALGEGFEKGKIRMDNDGLIGAMEKTVSGIFRACGQPNSIAQYIRQVEAQLRRL